LSNKFAENIAQWDKKIHALVAVRFRTLSRTPNGASSKKSFIFLTGKKWIASHRIPVLFTTLRTMVP
jgi:hypothetical protein